MEHYYVNENPTTKNGEYIAAHKAREDVYKVFQARDYIPINVSGKSNQERIELGAMDRIREHFRIAKSWDLSISGTISNANNSIVWIQFPPKNHSLRLGEIIKKHHKQGVKIGLIIHDINIFRLSLSEKGGIKKSLKIKVEESPFLSIADFIIAHNPAMIDSLASMGISRNKLFNLQIFDYLMDTSIKAKVNFESPIIVAGNLHSEKAGFVYNLPDNVNFNLYGVNYKEQDKKHVMYKGFFPSNELPERLEGSFGLIWDGDSSETCSGAYGSYLRINNPHKTSLYLASGLPVIIWKHAALAPFIEENHCGILVESLKDISSELKNINQSEYDNMVTNVQKIRELLINGYFTNKVLSEIEDVAGNL
ncbi:MAG: hypothetical protein IJH64_04345 [Oscillospiraceae bacterium]|nr:hypothetical protein [Oscillospiraceae bacterium]